MDGAEITTRLDDAAALIAERDIDLLLAAPSADLRYLLGYGGHASERPTLLVIAGDGKRFVMVPELEAARLRGAPLEVLTYGETENPYQVVSDAVGEAGAGSAAVTDRMWAAVLLGLQAAFPHSRFLAAGPVLRDLRMVKSPAELELLREAGQRADAAFSRIVKTQFSGRREREVADELAGLLEAEGLEVSEWRPIVASGPNSSSPHHMTGDRAMQEGDAVILDFGGALEGYQADMSRTVHIGEPESDFRQVYDVVRRAQQAGVQAVRPGVQAQSVDQAARQAIAAAGYGQYFIHRTGHGVGLDVHEEPYIVAGNDLPLREGMVFSVEPGVYLPGKFGVRIEDVVAVGADAGERLNQASRELAVVR